MNGKYLLDTNAVLYLLSSGNIVKKLQGKQLFISFITELELLSYPAISENELIKIKFFLSKVTILNISKEIKLQTILFRKKYKFKLPDSIISASAFILNYIFVTNDKKLFKIDELNVLRYEDL